MAKLLDEIHPGEILLEDFMKPMSISARQLVADIDVLPSRISELSTASAPSLRTPRFGLGCPSPWSPGFG
jgi:plasmid maintenance system antidote protein VapI